MTIFSEADRRKLLAEGVTNPTIALLEKHLEAYKISRDYSPRRLPVKAERRKLGTLRATIKALMKQLSELDPWLEERLDRETIYRFSRHKAAVLKELEVFHNELANVPEPQSKAGNKPLDQNLEQLLEDVTVDLAASGILPRKLGQQFNAIIGIVFGAVGIDESTVHTLRKKCWGPISAVAGVEYGNFIDEIGESN